MNRAIISQLRERTRRIVQQSTALTWLATGAYLNILAPLHVASRVWGRRYALKKVRVIDGATFDPLSRTWHTISFQATIEGLPVSYELTLHRDAFTMEVERHDPNAPDLFELPFVLVDEVDAAALFIGLLPAAVTATIGSPVYVARRAYFALKAEQARRLGLSPESHALYEALAPHLSTKVAELLLDVLRKQSAQLIHPSITVSSFDDLRRLLREADRFEAPTADPDLHSYRWELNGVEIAYAEPVVTGDGAVSYRFSLPPHLSSAEENGARFTPAEATQLLWCYKNTRRE